MAPPPRRSVGRDARVRRTALINTRLMASAHAWSSSSATLPRMGPRVLLTSTSRPPSVAVAHATRSRHWSACRTSATRATTSYPSSRSALAAAWMRSSSLEEMATRQPSAASARAEANPRPRLAAVTSARRPRSPVSTGQYYAAREGVYAATRGCLPHAGHGAPALSSARLKA